MKANTRAKSFQNYIKFTTEPRIRFYFHFVWIHLYLLAHLLQIWHRRSAEGQVQWDFKPNSSTLNEIFAWCRCTSKEGFYLCKFNKTDGLILVLQRWVLFLSSFTVVVDWSKSTTCLHFYTLIYSKYDVVKRFPHTFITLNNSLSSLIIPGQRLVTMSVSLLTQTALRCLIIQVLNIKSLLPKCLIQSLSLLYTVI